MVTVCNTSPSSGCIDTLNRHFCHCSSLPSTVKLVPSGWVMSSGFRSVRIWPTCDGV